jgi:hypothetical protein
MNGYVEAGYVVVLGSLSTYAVVLTARERAARLRLGQVAKTVAPARELERSVSASLGAPGHETADAPENESEHKGSEAAL